MHNPLRSEAEMFRLVVIFGLGAALVIAVALLTEPVFGAIVLAVELGVGIGLLWRGARGSLPHEAEVAHAEDDVHRLVVVANQTVGGRALLEEIRARCAGRGCEVFLVVPALTASRLEHLAHDVDAAIADARARLDASLATLRAAGLRAEGQVGDHHDPNAALEDALREFAADEVIVSTHPPERSRWLEQGVVARAREEIPLPVTHVIVDLEAEAGAQRGMASGGA